MTGATIPIPLNDERFIQAWQEYLDYRRERRLPKLLPRSQQKQLDRLADHGIEVAVAAIEETIAQGWTGIFPDRVRLGDGRAAGRNDRRASLGALQMELRRVTEALNDISNPGGCAHPQPIPGHKKAEFDRLLARRKELKLAIDNHPLQ